ncbi:MAG: T9SS type A sorting domain-containing protein [Bacteroidales bacterium]|nr:T9SS type A sorting domain-containing protein [Bacteroidales bacterium]
MKKVISFFVFMILTINIFSQDYYPLIQEGNTWNVLVVYLKNMFLDTTYSTTTYKLTGDTIIDSKTYKKLYKSDEKYPVNWGFWRFMREDTDKKVWLRHKSSEQEFLMYDFSVKVGDSVLVGDSNLEVYLHVDSISDVVINQSHRKQIWLSDKYDPHYYSENWIEGVGSNKGICWSGSMHVVGGWYRLLCMFENEYPVYENPYYESCYMVTAINELESPSIDIFPNPAKNLLFIKNREKLAITSIVLFNANGQMIRAFDKMAKQFDISDILPGCYIFKIITETGVITRKLAIN